MIPPQCAFGKLERDNLDVVVGWHPLLDHMTDVAACFECLCSCHSIRRALETAAERKLDERDIARLSVLAFMHDIGKANSGFQAKRWKTNPDIPKGWPQHAGHGIEAIKLFETEAYLVIAPLIENICTWGEASEPLLIASISHHGRPLKKEQYGDWNKNIWKSVASSYCPSTVLKEIGECAEAIYSQAFESGGEPLPEAHAFAHLFAGLVQLADWLGSDTTFFPFSEPGEDRAASAKAKARNAISVIGLDADDWRNKLKQCAPSFATTFGNPDRPFTAPPLSPVTWIPPHSRG